MSDIDVDDLKDTVMLQASRLTSATSAARPKTEQASLTRVVQAFIEFLKTDQDIEWSHKKTALTEAVETITLPVMMGKDIPIGKSDHVLDYVIHRATKNLIWLNQPLEVIEGKLIQFLHKEAHEEALEQKKASTKNFTRAKM